MSTKAKNTLNLCSLIVFFMMVGTYIGGLAVNIQATPINPTSIPTVGNAELQGDIWYVDGNRLNNSGDGKTWASAYKLLATAMAASHADIARSSDRQWAARNTIYVKGDEIEEDITKLAQKTDIIGVGSNSGYGKAGITGTWIIPDTVNYMGCHFYNMMFTDEGATAIWDVDTQSGLEFHECLFDSGTSTTIGIELNESDLLVIDNCEFTVVSATKGFSTAAIVVVNATNVLYDIKITNNIIETAGIGIDWNESDSHNCWIADNYIFATGLVIDDDGDQCRVVNNRLITEVDVDTHGENTGWDFNPNLSVGNELIGSASEVSNTIPIVEESDAT